MKMHLRKGYAAPRKRPKRLAKKLKKRYGWAKCRVPCWIVVIEESKALGVAAGQALNRITAKRYAERELPHSLQG